MFYNAYICVLVWLYFILCVVFIFACLYLYMAHEQNSTFLVGINKVFLIL